MRLKDTSPYSPFGSWRYGKEYLEAYIIIKNAKENWMDLFSVKFYLLGHSIELSLKAYLLNQGFTEIQLKTEFGHNLEALLGVCSINGLNKILSPNPEEVESIKLLNLYYSKKEFEYHKRGGKTVPAYTVIEDFARKLTKSIYKLWNPKRVLDI